MLYTVFAIAGCTSLENESIIQYPTEKTEPTKKINEVKNFSLIILGTIQGAGLPQINWDKTCCEKLHLHSGPNRKVVSLGFVDTENKEIYIFEATPDISSQLANLSEFENFSASDIPTGVFLTHAHIGHYTGLMYFGKEATDASNVPVYAMPKMKDFLEKNGPWSQLVNDKNIVLIELNKEEKIAVNSNLTIIPFIVPHRDEFSETVGYKIIGPNNSALFIPDIDKWQKWEKDIIKEIENVDYAFLDATFYSRDEILDREISEIPHPFVLESMEHFKDLSPENKSKIYFIHINHSNPILDPGNSKTGLIEKEGYHVAKVNDIFEM